MIYGRFEGAAQFLVDTCNLVIAIDIPNRVIGCVARLWVSFTELISRVFTWIGN